MGVSTYCQFGSTESHAHCRNAEIPCDCACHTQDQGAPMTTLAEHRVLEGAPDANGTTAPKQKGKRRRWSDDEKRRIALEYSEAPKGAGHAVIAKYELSSSMVIKWCRDLGLTARKRQSRAGRAAPPRPAGARTQGHRG